MKKRILICVLVLNIAFAFVGCSGKNERQAQTRDDGIFQPEMRRFLGYLGQQGFLNKLFSRNDTQISHKVDVVKELIESIKYLCKTKTGALIVLKKDLSQNTYAEVGTQ